MIQKNRTLKAGLNHLLTNGNQKIVFGALKKLNIRPYRHDFEDYLQEARLAYARAYVRFPQDPEDNLKAFRVFAYQAVYWRTLNLLKRQTLVKDWRTNEVTADTLQVPRQYQCSSREQQVLADDLFRRLYAICTPAEKRFLYDCCVKQLSGREIAQKEGVSPQSISKRRRKVGKKALKIIAENATK
ncbi:sigma-70 family RNA polymerase sigma factor [Pediococcus acidilactici]